MRQRQQAWWHDRDLLYVARVLAPGNDSGRIVQAMRDDPELFEAMLADDRLFHNLMDDPSQMLDVSGRLFFMILLNKTRDDLRKQTFTFERDNRYSVVVFDASEVIALLDDHTVRYYLADMMASFARIDKTTLYIRVSPGVLRRVQVDDFDIESLIEYSRFADDAHRLLSCKRIGDICLLLLGVFSDYLEVQRLLPGGWYRAKSKKELTECGVHYYREALRHVESRQATLLDHALRRLCDDFTTAVKPLMYVSSRYLGFVKRTVFLQ